MGGLIESVGSNRRVQTILVCWLPPLLLGAFAFVIFVLPDVRGASPVIYLADAARTLHVNKFLFLFVASLAVATFMSVNRLPLWRILEGYLWPSPLRRWRVDRAHAPQAGWLRAKLRHEQAHRYAMKVKADLENAQQTGARDDEPLRQLVTKAERRERQWIEALAEQAANRRKRGRANPPWALGWLPRRGQPLFTLGRPEGGEGEWTIPYPADHRLMPTKLGNAMRSMEAYGAEKYGLDSQIMWFELLDVAPASLQSALEDVSLEADTLVCGIYTALALAAAALAGGAWRANYGTEDTKLWVVSAVSIALTVIFYRVLLGTAANWAFAIKSMIDGSRSLLREKYRLRAPTSAEDEKRMWEALISSRWYDYNTERERVLAGYRTADQDLPTGPGHS